MMHSFHETKYKIFIFFLLLLLQPTQAKFKQQKQNNRFQAWK